MMLGIDESGRPSTLHAGNPSIARLIACFRRIGVDCAEFLVPDMRSDTLSVSLLALENTALSVIFISPGRARTKARI